MNKFKLYTVAAVLASGMTLSACGDSFLTPEPASQGAAGSAGDPMNINSGLAAAYQILLLDSYANGSYESSAYIGDIQSDDLWKGGGDAQDGMAGMNLNVAMFTTTGNSTLSGTWNIYTSGITRVNSALGLCETATTDNPAELKLIAQYRGEGYFLRAYYLYMLWRSFGSVPFQETLYEPPYVGPQLSPDEVYAQIIKDIDASIASFKEAKKDADKEKKDPIYSTNDGTNNGRASLAAALMLKARVVMYQKDNTKYAEAAAGLAEIITSDEFELVPNFADIWVDEGEFNKESIFEANHIGEGKTWGNSWATGGTNLPAYISPSTLKDPSDTYEDGWGFGPVRPETYEMFAAGDTRRDVSIRDYRGEGTGGNVGDEVKIASGGTYVIRFQDTGFWLGKYAARKGYHKPTGDVALNYCNNLRIFRYAETLLAYAELVGVEGAPVQQGISAQHCLDMVRDRAFGDANHRVAVNRQNIINENHYEFVGEGHRYYDVVRWGITEVLSVDNVPGVNTSRTWKAHNKYVAIPQGDIDATKGTEFELKQNEGY